MWCFSFVIISCYLEHLYTINTLLELQANSLCESKIQKLSSMKKSLSLLSCYLVFILDHISSLSLDIIYISFNGLTKLPIKYEKKSIY